MWVGAIEGACERKLTCLIPRQVGTSAMRVEDAMGEAQKQRMNAMDELRDQLRESSQLASKNANRLRSRLEVAQRCNLASSSSLLKRWRAIGGALACPA